MTTISVWAPGAVQVDVLTGDDRTPMAPGGGGWWSAEAPAEAFTRGYLLSLEGGPGRPDPRSMWQPEGVNGPSRLLDLAALSWTDHAWRGVHLPSSVLYELHVGTFSDAGTFDGAIDHLDHLVDLGVDVVELMPVAEFPGVNGWGYDGVQLFAAHHAYGGPLGLARLVDACHARGLGVLLDVVYNHLGPSGNHLPAYGPYFTDRYRTPWGDAINVDAAGSDDVRRFIIDNARQWLEHFHLDGLRLDAVHAITDTSALHLLEELAAEVEALGASLGRPLWLVAESDRNDPRLVLPRQAGGYGLDAQWSDEVHHALHALLTGETDGYYTDFGSVTHLADALARGWVYGRTWSPHRRRHHGRPSDGLAGWTFVVSAQNHDQVGNRALGERLRQLTDPARAKVAAGLVLLSPFVPLLFQGEEWGATTPFLYFTDHHDPALAEAVRRGRRAEFCAFAQPDDVPDPQAEETFARSRLRWDERDAPPQREILDWYRNLLALRRHDVRLGAAPLETVRVHHDDDARWLVMERGSLAVCCHLADGPGEVPTFGRTAIVLASGETALDGAVLRTRGWMLSVLDG